VFKLITYGYEPPVTDVSKPNKQIYHICSVTARMLQSLSAVVDIHVVFGFLDQPKVVVVLLSVSMSEPFF
jgi:hypothetical protein